FCAAIAFAYAVKSVPGGKFACAIEIRLSPDCTVYSLNGDSVGVVVAAVVAVLVGADGVDVTCGVSAAIVASAVRFEAVAVGDVFPTTTGDSPFVSPGGRTSKTIATIVPTSSASSAPRYRLNEGRALAGFRQSPQ